MTDQITAEDAIDALKAKILDHGFHEEGQLMRLTLIIAAEVGRMRQNAKATNGVWQANLRLIAERDRLAAELAAANAREAGLREAIEVMRKRAMSTRGEQAYRELPAFILNTVRKALAQPSTDGGA